MADPDPYADADPGSGTGTGAGARVGAVDVLCCGLATLDLVQYVDRIPGPDEKLVAQEATLDAGGPATNAARTAAALGSVTWLVTMLGSGSLATSIRDRLAAEPLTVVDATPDGDLWRPPVSAITVDREGRRSVVSTNAGSAPPASLPSGLPAARVVLVDGHHLQLAEAVAESQRAGGATVVLDGGSWKLGLERLLAHVDIALLSADFACPPGHSAALAAVPHVAVSAGPEPIRVLAAPEAAVETVPVPAVDVVDTLGAGDVLHGALCHLLAAGTTSERTPDRLRLVAALEQAALIAARSCQYRGVLTWARQPG